MQQLPGRHSSIQIKSNVFCLSEALHDTRGIRRVAQAVHARDTSSPGEWSAFSATFVYESHRNCIKYALRPILRLTLSMQPENIYQFGADYFANKLNPVTESEPAPEEPRVDLHLLEVAASVDVSSMETSHFGALVLKLFVDADEDKSGYLDRIEFSNVLRNAELHLSEPQIRRILSEADDNDDNLIEYREFVPVMVDILQGIRADIESQAMKEEAEVLVRDAVDVLLRGMGKKDLETLMLKVFSKSDVDRNGTLDRKEFKNCLKSAHLGLTRKDINLIMSSVDLNQDGETCIYLTHIPFSDDTFLASLNQALFHTRNSSQFATMCLWSVSRKK